MFFRQYQLGCLSQFSYLVADETTGRAVVVDPRRDIGEYLDDTAAAGARIERVIETHFHADFLSGHLELAAATGAVVSYGPGATAAFPIETLAHGQRLALGKVELEVRHTPGHTPESISLVIHERAGEPPWGVLTGDALFIGDVGRPDLLGSVGFTPDELARKLYCSLHEQLLTLPDATRVFPAHGAGSSCGKNLSAAVESTIGEQRATNYALQPMSEDAFVDVVTQGQSVAPRYFGFAASANHQPHALLDDHEPPATLALGEVDAAVAAGAAVLDGRAPEDFASGHLRGALNVGLDGRFAEYAGDVLRPDQDVVLVTERGRETEARVRLGRIGFDRVAGALPGIEQVLAEHPERAAVSRRLPADDVAAWLDDDPTLQVVDVRSPGEWDDGTIPGARRVPLAVLAERLDELDRERPVVVHCAGGYRSMIAASVLEAAGFTTVADLFGGFSGWRLAGLPVEEARVGG